MNSLLERLERGDQHYEAVLEDGDPDSVPGPRIRESELDSFLRDVYTFYRRKGLTNIALTKILNIWALVVLTFVVLCAIHFVNYPYLLGWDVTGSDGPGETVFIFDISRIHPGTWVALGVMAVLLVFYALAAIADVKAHVRVARFYDVWLRIRRDDLDYVDWATVVERISRVSNLVDSSASAASGSGSGGGALTALDIMKRITRRENYMAAMVAKGVLRAELRLPLLGAPLRVHSQTLEWALGFTLWTVNYTTSGFRLSPTVSDDSADDEWRADWTRRLQRRLLWVGVAMGVLSPLMFVLLVAYIAFRYGEELRSRPAQVASAYAWTPYARWRLRELNEADHLFEERLARASSAGRSYAVGFPGPAWVVALAKFSSLVLGAVLLLLLLLSFVSERFVFALWGFSNVFYVTLLTAAIALCRALIPESDVAFDPEATLAAAARHTHYYPRHWRGAARGHKVSAEVGELYEAKPLTWLRELCCLFLVPLACVGPLRRNAREVVDFIADSTENEPRVGRSCVYAKFFDSRFSNSRCGASVHAPRQMRLPNGLMEKSFLSFRNAYSFWTVPDEGRFILARLAEYAAERERRRREQQEELAIPLSFTVFEQQTAAKVPMSDVAVAADVLMEFYEDQRAPVNASILQAAGAASGAAAASAPAAAPAPAGLSSVVGAFVISSPSPQADSGAYKPPAL